MADEPRRSARVEEVAAAEAAATTIYVSAALGEDASGLLYCAWCRAWHREGDFGIGRWQSRALRYCSRVTRAALDSSEVRETRLRSAVPSRAAQVEMHSSLNAEDLQLVARAMQRQRNAGEEGILEYMDRAVEARAMAARDVETAAQVRAREATDAETARYVKVLAVLRKLSYVEQLTAMGDTAFNANTLAAWRASLQNARAQVIDDAMQGAATAADALTVYAQRVSGSARESPQMQL